MYMYLSQQQAMVEYKHHSAAVEATAKYGWVLETEIKLLSHPLTSFGDDSLVILSLKNLIYFDIGFNNNFIIKKYNTKGHVVDEFKTRTSN